MSARKAMKHRALVQRNTAAAVGDFGEELAPTWVTLHAALPCWLYTSRGAESTMGTGVRVVESPAMLIPLGTDITEADRILEVKNRAAAVIGGLMRIASVVYVHDHMEVALEAVA